MKNTNSVRGHVSLAIIVSVMMLSAARSARAGVDFDRGVDVGSFIKKAAASDIGAPEAAMSPTAEIKTGVKSGCIFGEVTTKLHLVAQTAKSQLFVFADTEPLFREFVDMWTPILVKFNLKPTAVEYKDTFGTLSYGSADGAVIRDFMAEKLRYNALDPADMAKLRDELISALEKAGLTPVASLNLKNELFRPVTFNIYYLTKPEEDPDHEIRLRHLVNGDGEDLDFDIIAGAVWIVKKDAPFSLVYIGKELGFHGGWSDTEEGAKTKLEEYRKFLKENGQEFIGSRIIKLDKPYVSGDITVNYIVNTYFFR